MSPWGWFLNGARSLSTPAPSCWGPASSPVGREKEGGVQRRPEDPAYVFKSYKGNLGGFSEVEVKPGKASWGRQQLLSEIWPLQGHLQTFMTRSGCCEGQTEGILLALLFLPRGPSGQARERGMGRNQPAVPPMGSLLASRSTWGLPSSPPCARP